MEEELKEDTTSMISGSVNADGRPSSNLKNVKFILFQSQNVIKKKVENSAQKALQ